MSERLPMETVQRLHRSVGGDPIIEEFVLRFIGVHWNARSLFHLPVKVAHQILQRPADFIRAAKQHFEPELTWS